MSKAKKKYVSPKYEMIKFDSQIMTGWGTGCWGVVGVLFDANGNPTQGTCQTTHEFGENVLTFNNEYYD